MIHPPAAPMQRVEVRDRLGMNEEVAERLAPGTFPRQHTVEEPALVARQRLPAAGVRIAGVTHPLAVRVEGGIQAIYFLIREEVRHHQEALDVVEVFLAVCHGGVAYSSSSRRNSPALSTRTPRAVRERRSGSSSKRSLSWLT